MEWVKLFGGKNIEQGYYCYFKKLFNSQAAFTYSKLTIETLEQGVKYVQS